MSIRADVRGCVREVLLEVVAEAVIPCTIVGRPAWRLFVCGEIEAELCGDAGFAQSPFVVGLCVRCVRVPTAISSRKNSARSIGSIGSVACQLGYSSSACQ